MYEEEISSELQEENNNKLLSKKEWETPELFILNTDDTLNSANTGNDGYLPVS